MGRKSHNYNGSLPIRKGRRRRREEELLACKNGFFSGSARGGENAHNTNTTDGGKIEVQKPRKLAAKLFAAAAGTHFCTGNRLPSRERPSVEYKKDEHKLYYAAIGPFKVS